MNQSLSRKPVVTRFYNYLSFNKGKVIKGAPSDRFKKEIAWFKEAKKIIPDNIPRIYNYDKHISNLSNSGNLRYYEMQAIDGENLYQWIKDNRSLAFNAFDELVKLAKVMHQKSYRVKNEDKNGDVYQMYYLKPMKALEGFTSDKQIDLDSLVVNNQKIKNPIFLLENVFSRLKKRLIDTRYSFIHGDLTMSNVLIDRKGRLFLIDPRGAFGSTNIYGDVRYDVAKLYYSIIGNFDSLNNGQFSYTRDKSVLNRHTYSIISCGYSSYEEKLLNKFKEEPEVIQFIHTTIWFSLLPHVSNNLSQQFCVFCQGVYLLNSLKDYNF